MLKFKTALILALIFSFLSIATAGYIPDAEAQKSYRTTVQNEFIESPQPTIVRDLESREERMMETGQIERPLVGEIHMGGEKMAGEKMVGEKVVGGMLTGEKVKGTLVPVKDIAMLVGTKEARIYYKVAVNDKLYISVWRIPDLSLELIVGPDGKFSFPLIGDIDAAERTLSELDDEITEKLKEYVNDPQVSVVVKEFAGDKVTVIGEVGSPGIYKFVGKTNVIDVIATARGFTNRAKIVGVAIVRQPEDPRSDMKLIYVNAKNILKGKLRSTEVKPNDIVYVSRTFVSNLQELYTGWIVPLIGTAIDTETFRQMYRNRVKKMNERGL